MEAQDDSELSPGKTTPEETHTEEQVDSQGMASLPRTPDLLECNDELKASRKREREVSLEPATPQPTSVDVDTEHTDIKEPRTPKKKNRVSAALVAAQEEDEDPVLSCSPPHESKIRQISQGVEEITWQNTQKVADSDQVKEETEDKEEDHEMEDTTAPSIRGQEPATAELGREEEQVRSPAVAGQTPPAVDVAIEEDEQSDDADMSEKLTDTLRENNDEATSDEAKPNEATTDEATLDEATTDEATPDEATTDEAKPDEPIPDEAIPNAVTPSAESVTITEPASIPLPHSRRDSESDVDQEKGLKRKLADRAVSDRLVHGQTAPEVNGVAPESGTMKRQRDDPDEDANPRLTKRPTPPPDEEEPKASSSKTSSPTLSTPTVTPKLGGFMAYASGSSPFSAASGPSIFGRKPPSSPWASLGATSSGHTSPSLTASTFSPMSVGTASSSPFKESSSSKESQNEVHKRTGFEAFASSTSPFASAAKRPKSPPPPLGGLGSLNRSHSPSRHSQARVVNAFSAYATGGAHSFSAQTSTRSSGTNSPALGDGANSSTSVRASSSDSKPVGLGIFAGGKDEDDEEHDETQSDSGQTFGERLRAQKDEEKISDDLGRPALTEQEMLTGEEDEETVYQVRGKLYALSEDTHWKERGTGTLRLNVRRDDGTGARLVMRKEAVYTVVLNAPLFRGMRCSLAQDPRYLRFSIFEHGSTTHFSLRVANTKIAAELLEEINSHIPSE
ncbi:predicted protein [Sparassis crispa]|uniref:RanBD1 domain-containing protein n=1 Tax=Sparassis crispa TaxID=139825 RepID=A0A401H5I0_9APHY|nr:predicted protein [Sparassis crispa]GBE89643.1 predicted protein [Sparassis crispa]